MDRHEHAVCRDVLAVDESHPAALRDSEKRIGQRHALEVDRDVSPHHRNGVR